MTKIENQSRLRVDMKMSFIYLQENRLSSSLLSIFVLSSPFFKTTRLRLIARRVIGIGWFVVSLSRSNKILQICIVTGTELLIYIANSDHTHYLGLFS